MKIFWRLPVKYSRKALNLNQQKHAVEYAYRLDAAVNKLTAAALNECENLEEKIAVNVFGRVDLEMERECVQ